MTPATDLLLSKPNAAGHALLLRPEDRLVAINGVAFSGTEQDLVAAFAKAGRRPQALTFARGTQSFTVLASGPVLGDWAELPPEGEGFVSDRLNPDVLTNWEVLADAAGVYDLHPLRGSILALVAPPLWLLQMRLWVPAAALCAAAMVAAAVSVLMLLAVYLTAGLHLWHFGPRYFRKDRMARGFAPRFVLAAPTERAAHQAFAKLQPGARYVFAPAPAAMPEQVG